MATEKQKQAARRNLTKARAAQSARAKGKPAPGRTQGLSTAEENDLAANEFAFPEARKEPLTDASHVRNALLPASTRSKGSATTTATRRGVASRPPGQALRCRGPSRRLA